MSTRSVTTTQPAFANDSWQTQRNARTLQAFMALRQAEIGERISRLRRDRGNPPQEVVAQQIGVSYRSLQSWEAGDAKPSYRNLTKLADYFGVSEEFILMGEVDPSAPRNVTQLDRIEQKLDQLIEAAAALTQLDERLRLLEARAQTDAAEALERSEASSTATARPRRQQRR